MLTKLSWAALFFLLFNMNVGHAQTVGRKVSRLVVTDYNPVTNDALLEFIADTRMADCIAYVCVKNSNSKKEYFFQVSVEQYFLDEEIILFSIPIGNAKKYLRRKEEVTVEVIAVGVTGSVVLQKSAVITRKDLKDMPVFDMK